MPNTVDNIGASSIFVSNGTVVESTPTTTETIQENKAVMVNVISPAPNTIPFFNQDTQYTLMTADQLAGVVNAKSIRVTDTNIPALPDAELRKNKLLSFDSDGNPVVAFASSDSAQQLRIDLASKSNPEGASLIGYNGTTVENQLDHINEITGNFVSRVTEVGRGFSNWPQGKGIVVGSTAFFGFNLAADHGSVVQDAMIVPTTDGINWGKIRTIAKRTSTESASAWSLGVVPGTTDLFAIVRFRAGGGDTSSMRHSIYTSTNNGIAWTEIRDIPFKTKDNKDIVEFHGFVITGDGRIATGWHDTIGNLGIIIFNPATWDYETKVLMNAEDNNKNGAVLQCELNFLRRGDTGQILISSRTQDVNTAKTKTWVATDNFATIGAPVDTPVPYSVNPITMVYNPTFTEVWFIYAFRYDTTNPSNEQSAVWCIRRTLAQAFTQDWTNYVPVCLARNSAGYSNVAAVGGAQHAVLFGNKILIAFPSKVQANVDRSDIFCLNIEFNQKYKDTFAGKPLDSLQGAASDSTAELGLFGNSMYDPRIRMNGQAAFSLDLTNSRTMIGTYGLGWDYGIGIYNYTRDGSQTPALFVQPTSVSYGGKLGPIDLNRDLRILKPDSSIHLGTGVRIRVGGTTATLGHSFIYHNTANNTIEIGSEQPSPAMEVLMYSSNDFTFARAAAAGSNAAANLLLRDSSGNVTRLAAGGSVDGFALSTTATVSALNVRNNGAIIGKREIRGGAYNVVDLPTTGVTGGIVYCGNARKDGESAGNGTGCPVWFDGTNWLTFYNNTIATA